MRKPLLGLGLAIAALTPALALAAQPTPDPVVLKVSAKVSRGVGSKAKPVPVSVFSSITNVAPAGSRPEGWTVFDFGWSGVVSNGRLFPTCTADQIEAAQSDAGCPKGSLVATGIFRGVVGPDNDYSQPGVKCAKDARYYNAGQNKIVTLLVGPASSCAGVGYLPPFPSTWVAKGTDGGQTFVNPVPSYIARALPGIIGSPLQQTANFTKRTVASGGRERGYLESVGCKGKRGFVAHATGDPDKKVYSAKASAGAC